MSNGFDNVLIVVDNLTRMAHFQPRGARATAYEIASLFLHGVCILHGLPRVLVSNRDPKFDNAFWQIMEMICKIIIKHDRRLLSNGY
jgi:hypothetical protein